MERYIKICLKELKSGSLRRVLSPKLQSVYPWLLSLRLHLFKSVHTLSENMTFKPKLAEQW